jgi:CBS domain-containing protein
MKIGDICTRDVRTGRADTTLADAAASLWSGDCGILPIVNARGRLIGVITDRDICVALITHDSPPSKLTVGEIMVKDVHACRPQDEVAIALQLMSTYKVRRLPVTDDEDTLDGILSIDDLLFHAEENERSGDLSLPDVVRTFRAICGHYVEKSAPLGETGRKSDPTEAL